MFDLFRLAFMATAVLFVALAATLQQPEIRNDLGLEQLASWKPASSLWQKPPDVDPPDQRHQILLKRMEAKGQITRELLAQRLTLVEAAARFRSLDQLSHDSVCPPRYSALSPEERYCQQVIDWVGGLVQCTSPNDYGKAVARLEKELRDHKECHGKVILPEVVMKDDLSPPA